MGPSGGVWKTIILRKEDDKYCAWMIEEKNKDYLRNWVWGCSHHIMARKSSYFPLMSWKLGRGWILRLQISLLEEIAKRYVTSKLRLSYCFLLLVIYTRRESRKTVCSPKRWSLKLHTEQEKAATVVRHIRTIKEKRFTLHRDHGKCAPRSQTTIKIIWKELRRLL